MPDLPEPVLDLQLCQNSLLTAMERCLTAFGQDAMEQNSMVRHTSFSVPAKQCTVKQAKHRQKEQIAYYMNNAKEIRNALSGMGYTVFGGVNAPYIWLQTPDGMKSWDFFDMLLEKANVVGTPGSGFGPSGEGYFRLTAFGSAENTKKH